MGQLEKMSYQLVFPRQRISCSPKLSLIFYNLKEKQNVGIPQYFSVPYRNEAILGKQKITREIMGILMHCYSNYKTIKLEFIIILFCSC